MPETTDKHFEIFIKESEKIVDDLGLKDWNVQYTHGDVDEENNAECAYMIGAKSVWLKLALEWGEKDVLDDQAIKETAWHEVFHILLAQLEYLAKARFIQERELLIESHTLIQRLVNYTRLWEARVRAAQATNKKKKSKRTK